MLTWAIIFLIVAIIAGFFGFRDVENLSLQIAKVLFFLFLVMFVVFFVLSFMGTKVPVSLPMSN